MSKKDAAIYRKAAALQMEADYFACHLIDFVAHRNVYKPSAQSAEYAEVFKPKMTTPTGDAWSYLWGKNAVECSVLSLLFAAVMAETDDL